MGNLLGYLVIGLVVVCAALLVSVVVWRIQHRPDRSWERVFLELTVEGVPFFAKPNRFGPFADHDAAVVWERRLREALHARNPALEMGARFTYCWDRSRQVRPKDVVEEIVHWSTAFGPSDRWPETLPPPAA